LNDYWQVPGTGRTETTLIRWAERPTVPPLSAPSAPVPLAIDPAPLLRDAGEPADEPLVEPPPVPLLELLVEPPLDPLLDAPVDPAVDPLGDVPVALLPPVPVAPRVEALPESPAP